MRKSIGACIAGICITSSAGAVDTKTFEYPRYGLTLSYPSNFVQATGTLSGDRPLFAFTSPDDEDVSASVVFTGVQGDYTRLGSFGDKTTIRGYLFPSEPEANAKMITEKVNGENYFIEYTIAPPGETERHVQSIFALKPAEAIVSLTVQAPETLYEKYKSSLFDVVASSLRITP